MTQKAYKVALMQLCVFHIGAKPLLFIGPGAAVLAGERDPQSLDASEKGGFVDPQIPGRRRAVISIAFKGGADNLGIKHVVGRADSWCGFSAVSMMG